jgi:hypothetical protein
MPVVPEVEGVKEAGMAMMCEKHTGQEWPHVVESEDCGGPGMPWECGKGMFEDHPPYMCEECNAELRRTNDILNLHDPERQYATRAQMGQMQ